MIFSVQLASILQGAEIFEFIDSDDNLLGFENLLILNSKE